MTAASSSVEYRATWSQTWHTHIKPFLAANIIVALFSWVIGYVIGGYTGSVVLPVLLIGGLLLLQRVASRGHAVRVSPTGVEVLRRDGRIARVRWPDIRAVVVINRRTSAVIAPWGPGRAAAQVGAQMFADANTGPGITGLGELLTHAQAAHQRQAGDTWLPLAEPQVLNLSLAMIDRNWPTGPIGTWFRQYRPDLLS